MEAGRVRLIVAAACALLALPGAGRAVPQDEEFPEPERLKSAVAFWMRVYLEATTDGGLIHDSRHLGVVYETLHLESQSRRARQRQTDGRKKHWRVLLDRLAAGQAPATEPERAIAQMFELELGRAPTGRDYREARHRLRFQLGQRNKFRNGLVRSGRYEAAMRATFLDRGLPEDLAYLPHVESSFNVRAYSKYGAAGVWQFMRGTGRRYMKVDYVVDERLDPMRATDAAARLLRDNYEALGSWPLAITAYNHGAAGMARAKRKLGTDAIDEIVARYQSRTFGFASRNFYTQFLAARRIVRSYESYFGSLQRDVPETVDEVELPFYASVEDIEKFLGVSPEVVGEFNPALRPPVFRSKKRVPKGYVLQLPAGTIAGNADQWLAQIPAVRRHDEQYRSNYHVVQRGDTLGRIARRYRTRIGTLVALNNLPSRHRIFPGQVLQLPDGNAPPPSKRGLVKTARAAPATAPKKIEPARIKPAPATPPVVGADSPFRRIEGNRIIVDAGETLGHYADWLEIPTQRLRNLNGLSSGRRLRLGQRLKLDFSRISEAEFLQRRVEFHKGIEEDFFGNYRVTGTLDHKLKRGESLWILSHKIYSVPIWLIQRYNPGIDLTRLTPGEKLAIPVTERNG
jgi:membrane-bound lytic murein transglycosylase D